MSIDAVPPSNTAEAPVEARKWKPLNRVQRRVAGVLVEKAKTTPEQYPLSLNGLTTGCNQKNNRSPQMTLQPDDVETAIEQLRDMGVVVEIQGGGRVAKYKHLLYEWLGVDKTELAVMAELLLRGEQTVGELRGRAARMEPIADLGALRPILDSLMHKGLVIELTPAGRGQVVTHALLEPTELARLKAQHSSENQSARGTDLAEHSPHDDAPTAGSGSQRSPESNDELRHEVQELRERVSHLESEVQALRAMLS